MARVELSCQGHTHEYNIAEELIIGRDEDCDIKLPSIKASRKHCRIFKATGGYFIEDLGSANGTVLNGVMVGRKLLKHNDEIEAGRIRLRFIDKTEDPLIGKRLGRYQIVEKIGLGTEGVVYHGRQVALNEDVAVKLFRNDQIILKGGIKKVAAVFAKALEFEHPNVVKIIDFAEDGGRVFCAMELVKGENLLSRCIRKQRLKVAEVVEYGLSLCDALSALHGRGLGHGDIKPHNIVVTENGTVKFIDLGWVALAADVQGADTDSSEEETEESVVTGGRVFTTPQYVAPELIRHEPYTALSDIYALSVTFYQLLTGSLPYNSDHIEELLHQHLQGEVRNPRELNSRISPELAELIICGMSTDISQRINTASEYYRRLNEIADKLKNAREKNRELALQRLRMQRFGYMRFGLVYKLLIALVVLLLGGSYGFRIYKEYKHKQYQQEETELAAGRELYERGNYEEAEDILRKLSVDGANTAVVTQADELLKLLELPDSVKELQLIKQDLKQGKITRKDVVVKIRERLRKKNLAQTEEQEYVSYLKSLGGDTDIRYVWQKKLDGLIANNNLSAAYNELFGLDRAEFDNSQNLEYEAYAKLLQTEISKQIEKEYQRSAELLKSRRLTEATVLLDRIVNNYPADLGWQGRILEFFAKSNEAVAGEINETLNNILKYTAKLDYSGMRENIFRLEDYAAQQISPIRAGYLQQFSEFIDAFQRIFFRRVESVLSNTGKPVALEVAVKGLNRLVPVTVVEDHLVAALDSGGISIGINDIMPSSIEKFLPVSELSFQESLGTGLYLYARGALATGKGYITYALDNVDVNSAEQAQWYALLLAGRLEIPVRDSLQSAGIAAVSSVRLGGSSIVVPAVSGIYRFAAAEHGELVIAVGGERIEVYFEKHGIRDLLGGVPVIPDEKGVLELKGYWDKLLLSQNEIMLGDFNRAEIGNTVIAPVLPAAGKFHIYKDIRIKVSKESVTNTQEESLG